jgi:hypothetical protein
MEPEQQWVSPGFCADADGMNELSTTAVMSRLPGVKSIHNGR